jgi:antiviral helicase SKI2
MDKRSKLFKQLSAYQYMLSNDSLFLKPEFDCRVKVLQQLNYVNEDKVVQLKGKVAREVCM